VAAANHGVGKRCMLDYLVQAVATAWVLAQLRFRMVPPRPLDRAERLAGHGCLVPFRSGDGGSCLLECWRQPARHREVPRHDATGEACRAGGGQREEWCVDAEGS
jgi:hypothetical protein